MPATGSIALFLVVLLLPIVVSVLVVIIPTRRQEASGIVLGNPLHAAPLARQEEDAVRPLVQLCRLADGRALEGYVLGLRHLPVRHVAPVLDRLIRGHDPALQLYAQGVLQQGVDKLHHAFQTLLASPPEDARKSAWLLETGLSLAHSSLNSTAERQAWLTRLVGLARARTESARPDPGLLAVAAEVYLEAGLPQEAAALIQALPEGSPLRQQLQLVCAHALHQGALPV